MKVIRLTQNWKGFFTYLDGYDGLDQYKDVDFSMELELNDKSFIGLSTDVESKDFFDKPATVKGFFDDEKISFVLKYPCAYYKNENGEIILDRNSEHPDIHYLGFFSDDKKFVSGNWEMTIYQEEYLDGYINDVLRGSFEMRLST